MPTSTGIAANLAGADRSSLANGFSLPASRTSTVATQRPAKYAGTVSDEWLLALIVEHDKSAMHALYSRYSVRVYRFVTRLTRNAALAEDLVSEVFVDVWRSAKTFRAQSQVSTWLYSIARHKALSALRRRSDQALDDELVDDIKDGADTPEDILLGKDRSTLLQVCLSNLSALHREVIDLVYYHERSIHEVAQIVGVSENTIKTRLHYARKQIERMLAQSGITSLH